MRCGRRRRPLTASAGRQQRPRARRAQPALFRPTRAAGAAPELSWKSARPGGCRQSQRAGKANALGRTQTRAADTWWLGTSYQATRLARATCTCSCLPAAGLMRPTEECGPALRGRRVGMKVALLLAVVAACIGERVVQAAPCRPGAVCPESAASAGASGGSAALLLNALRRVRQGKPAEEVDSRPNSGEDAARGQEGVPATALANLTCTDVFVIGTGDSLHGLSDSDVEYINSCRSLSINGYLIDWYATRSSRCHPWSGAPFRGRVVAAVMLGTRWGLSRPTTSSLVRP
eukprot:scaffold1446_cov391-Prasinococcus_capsulatus_cf.AAC.26